MNGHLTTDTARMRELPCICRPPPGVRWRSARPRTTHLPLRAELARRNGALGPDAGRGRYSAGRHYIVTYAPGDRTAFPRRLFERSYQRGEGGRYEARPGALLQYFTMPYRVVVDTGDGLILADAGDWIVQADAGELWPVAANDAAEHFDAA